MTTKQKRQVAPTYDADIYFSMYTQGDYLICGKCGWKRTYVNDQVRAKERIHHATPVQNPNTFDINCKLASWNSAIAAHAILNP